MSWATGNTFVENEKTVKTRLQFCEKKESITHTKRANKMVWEKKPIYLTPMPIQKTTP